MKNYSQNNEQEHILSFFHNQTSGILLSIGENDGFTFSNARALIELGWQADLVEPSPTCAAKLRELYKEANGVIIHELAIANQTGIMHLNESGSLLGTGDVSLVSTLIPKEKERWGEKMEWNKISVQTFTYEDFCGSILRAIPEYDFISIDAEGMDLVILRQIDLTPTQLICIEWNSIPEVRAEIISYCEQFGMTKIIYESGENLLICRP